MADTIIFKPTKKQAEFLASTADICLMGGGVASGKTLAAIFVMLRMNERLPGYKNPRYNSIMIRRHYKDLRDIIAKTQYWYPLVDPGAKYNKSDMIWTFSSGAKIQFAYFDNLESCQNMVQGAEYATCLIDEAMHFETDEIFLYLLSRLRNTYGMKPLMRLTSNPGKYKWLREFFKINNIGESTDFTHDYILEDGTIIKKRIQYIQAKITDNKHIPKDYQATLMMLNEEEKLSLLLGRWDAYSVKGGIYTDLIAESRKNGKVCKVPYDSNLIVNITFDLGFNDTTAIIFSQSYGKEIRVFDHIEDSGKHISFYFNQIVSKQFNSFKIILPHDARAKTVGADYSVEEQAIKLFGSSNVIVLDREGLELGISTTKNMFNDLYIDEKCERLLECLEMYKRKLNKATGVYEEPLHDIYSNTADSLRYLAMYMKTFKTGPTLDKKKLRPNLTQYCPW